MSALPIRCEVPYEPGGIVTDDLTFASSGVAGVHYARCEPCMYLQCPGGKHDWAGPEDVEHAAATGQPSPVGLRCACHCYDEPERDQEPPDIDLEPLAVEPCPVCGEQGACGWDAEGRPLIHADWDAS